MMLLALPYCAISYRLPRIPIPFKSLQILDVVDAD